MAGIEYGMPLQPDRGELSKDFAVVVAVNFPERDGPFT
jgi:hypothetical protein